MLLLMLQLLGGHDARLLLRHVLLHAAGRRRLLWAHAARPSCELLGRLLLLLLLVRGHSPGPGWQLLL